MTDPYTPGTPTAGTFVSYLRVSTSKQGADGYGIDAQRQAITNHLDGGDWKLLDEFREVESGRKAKRPELEKALALCAKTGATLIVAKLDRLARNVAFVSRLMESGIRFVAADQPHANDLTIHIIAAMAQYEAEQVSRRTKAALAVVRARGGKVGSDNIEEVAARGRAARSASAQAYAEQVYPTIERIRSFGITTLRGIAQELTDRKIETPARQAKIDAGKAVFGSPEWHPQQVKALLERMANK
jgi:DNA invertase Pin-like site-specific DNA recombinase|tara:strand:- start:147 stop:878 length:732 start_codon:yes stop_codon:yes gene_type:complete